MSGLYSLIYRSYARPPWMGDRTLNDIAAESHAFNGQNNISGVLLFADGVFIQVLEGSTVDVLKLTARIAADRRNERLRALWHGVIEERRFPEWNMGCFDVTETPEAIGTVMTTLDAAGEGRDGDAIWTQDMTDQLIQFYAKNEMSGISPVFNAMRRIV
ncbi:MAG: BLUF domain-containing protein [Pseudomonadota bacterium]